MIAAQSGESGRIVSGRFFGIDIAGREQMPGHHRSASSHGHAVEEITARDVAVHSEFAVVSVAHARSRICYPSDFLTANSAPWNPMRLWVPSQKGLFTEPPQRQRENAGLPVRSYGVPLTSTSSTEPSGASTR